jgi:hypothetical protein
MGQIGPAASPASHARAPRRGRGALFLPGRDGSPELDRAVLAHLAEKLQPARKGRGTLRLRRKRRRDEEPRLSGVGRRRQEIGERGSRLRRGLRGGKAGEKRSRWKDPPQLDLRTTTFGNKKSTFHDRRSRRQSPTPSFIHRSRGRRTRGQFHRSSVIWRGSGCASPLSTLLTISVRSWFARAGMPISSPFLTTRPLRKSISVRRPFTMS